jgi:hypothetical protein
MPIERRYDIGKLGSLTKYWQGEYRVGGEPDSVISARKIKEVKPVEYKPPIIKPPEVFNLPTLSKEFKIYSNQNSNDYKWNEDNSITITHNFKTLHVDYIIRWNGLHQVICQDRLIDINNMRIFLPNYISLSASDFFQIIIFPIMKFDDIINTWQLPIPSEENKYTYFISAGNIKLDANQGLWNYFYSDNIKYDSTENEYVILHNLNTENIKIICRDNKNQKIYVQYTIVDGNKILLHLDNVSLSQLSNILIYTNIVSQSFSWDTLQEGWLYLKDKNLYYTNFQHNYNCFTRI